MIAQNLARGVVRNLLPPAITLAIILLGWEAYSRLVLDAIPGGSRLLPAPTSVIGALVTNTNDLAVNTWQTVLEVVIGFVLALATGFAFAVLIDLSPLARRAIYPLLVVSQTIPVLALAPILVLWFGFGILPKILVVGLVCFFPIVVAGVDGFRATDPELIRLFRTFGAGRWAIFTHVRLPGALPALFSGIRIAVTYCVIGAVWGEYVGAQYGLGIFMQRKQHAFDVATVFASVVVISAISIALFLLTSLIERAVIPWYFRAGDRSSSSIFVP